MGVALLLFAALRGQGPRGALEAGGGGEGRPNGGSRHQPRGYALPQDRSRAQADRPCGRARARPELVGVMLESRLPDVSGLGRRARRPGGTDALVAEVLGVELGHGDAAPGEEVLGLVVLGLLSGRRRGRPGLTLRTHLGLDATERRPHPSHAGEKLGRVGVGGSLRGRAGSRVRPLARRPSAGLHGRSWWGRLHGDGLHTLVSNGLPTGTNTSTDANFLCRKGIFLLNEEGLTQLTQKFY